MQQISITILLQLAKPYPCSVSLEGAWTNVDFVDFGKFTMAKKKFTSVELCAGAGGQALGLEMAGFDHSVVVEIDKDACSTLRLNRPKWDVIEQDLKLFSAKGLKEIDLVAGGVPCPPFSIAGKQLGQYDDRDLFPEAIRVIEECNPKAVMLENVRGLSSAKFDKYRMSILKKLKSMGYESDWRVLNACDYGVPQLRPRFILVALKQEFAEFFHWPDKLESRVTVSETLFDLMSSNGWKGAQRWSELAGDIAPTLVGGSKKHGGADLGPTRAREKWLQLGVDGKGLTEVAPAADDHPELFPRLTLRMAARIQGFPDSWSFSGKKTASYRQIGNAFPPPVAKAIGERIFAALSKKKLPKSQKASKQSPLFELA